MKKAFGRLAAILLVMMVQSCSDDGQSIYNDGDGDDVDCEDVSCPKGKYCYKGKCKSPVKEGKKCLKGVPCATGTECVDDICMALDSSDDGDDNNNDDDDKSCTSKSDCPKNKVCVNGGCVLPNKDGDDCNSDDECAKGSRCLNGQCAAWQKEGEDCEWDGDKMCAPDSLACNDDGKCVPIPKKGEACEGILAFYCAPGLSCENDICVGIAKPGENCSELDICSENSVCEDGICKSQVKLGDSCDASFQICEEGAVCQGGVCLKNYGECQTNSDCNADSYCCLMDSCDTKNVCFPYGEGPGGTFDPECKYQMVPGLFEASIQCEWPLAEDHISASDSQIMATVVAADLPFDSNGASEIVTATFGDFIAIVNGETCKLLQRIDTSKCSGTSSLALADLDNDGKIEIISGDGGITAWHWNDSQGKYVEYWSKSSPVGSGGGGPSIHDVNNDGFPEIIIQWGVFDGRTGNMLNSASTNVSSSCIPVLGDVDNDGNVELVGNSLYRWDNTFNTWQLVPNTYQLNYGRFLAYADFGTPQSNGGFDFTQKDGIAEIVSIGSRIQLVTLSGQILMDVTSKSKFSQAGPPNIGDFDGDGMPEIGVAGQNTLTVYDPQCTITSSACLDDYILWESISQDESSGVTGSSTFDFDSDGRLEVIYGDECFTRIYDGQTGEVLFSSYRTSNTMYENPIIADVDHDMSAEIVMCSDSIAPDCPEVDPNHRGVRCVENADCFSANCVQGYCRCQSDSDCNWQYDGNGILLDEYSCTNPLAPQNISDGKVCRAKHPKGIRRPGFRILRDRLDRWASTRTIWNQHAYSVTNINEDGTVPKTSDWKQNFLDPSLNNYRQNSQGKVGAGYAPDITGRLDESTACIQNKDQIVHIGGTLCNRGVKDVGSKLPATFYLGDPADNNILCTSYTDSNVV